MKVWDKARKSRFCLARYLCQASIFYYLLAITTSLLSLSVILLAQRVTVPSTMSLPNGYIPAGLFYLYRFRMVWLTIPIVLIVMGMLAPYKERCRSPIMLGFVSAVLLALFFIGSVMLLTPVLAWSPIGN